MDPAGAVEHEHFYDFSVCGVYNSEIVVYCLRTMHKTVFLNFTDLGIDW